MTAETTTTELFEKAAKVRELITGLSEKLFLTGTMMLDGKHYQVPYIRHNSTEVLTDAFTQEHFDTLKQIRELLGEICTESFKVGVSFHVNLSVLFTVNGTRANYSISESNGIGFTLVNGSPFPSPFQPVWRGHPGWQGYPGVGNPGLYDSHGAW